jgi:hypothetical protein
VELADGGEAVFRRPDGRVIPHVPPPAVVEEPLRGLLERVASAGVTIDPSALPTWDGSGCDFGWAVEWFRQGGASPARGGNSRVSIMQSPPACVTPFRRQSRLALVSTGRG